MKKKERQSEVKRRENHRSAFVCVRVYFFSTTRVLRAREREKESTEKLSVEGFEIKFFHRREPFLSFNATAATTNTPGA
jgi:hypothetical protein